MSPFQDNPWTNRDWMEQTYRLCEALHSRIGAEIPDEPPLRSLRERRRELRDALARFARYLSLAEVIGHRPLARWEPREEGR